ncbi:UDP-glucuronosyltransferase 2B33-like [Pangasianodon hypophthalmus]|uniref:UDP-glucuronosyltransferase 2B33-like n=1 Tax=Pangasianodon hypophthalmus TaxID=310915 RepID=UPI002307CC13|nr:UDP-glucuronosyltransferase 2B33-like [Pangasianodon hypophthalmus]
MSACERAALCLFLLLSLSQTPLCVTAGKILVWPADFSHWLNINVIIDELIARGHSVTVVTHSATPSVRTDQSPGYNVEIIQVPYTKQDIFNNLDLMFKYWVNEVPNDNMIQVFLKIKEVLDKTIEQNQVMCRELFAREDLLEKWRKEQFDVLLTDPMYMCRALLALKLNLPFIVSLRFSFGSSMERLCGQLPTPASYVPSVSLGYTNQMDFPQRVKNILFNLFQDLLFMFLTATKWDPLYTELMASHFALSAILGNCTGL